MKKQKFIVCGLKKVTPKLEMTLKRKSRRKKKKQDESLVWLIYFQLLVLRRRESKLKQESLQRRADNKNTNSHSPAPSLTIHPSIHPSIGELFQLSRFQTKPEGVDGPFTLASRCSSLFVVFFFFYQLSTRLNQ